MPNLELTAILNRPDPLLNFKWMCLDSTLPFGLPVTYLEGVEIPFNNVAVGEEMFFESGYIMYPGPHKIGQVQMTLYEDSNARTMRWIHEWKSKIKDFSTGGYGLPVEYKQDIKLGLLTTKNEVAAIATLIGIWPTDTTTLSLAYTATERVVMSQSFAIDDLEITWNK